MAYYQEGPKAGFEEETRESRYNSAVAQLIRLNSLLDKAHKFSLAGDRKDYIFCLERVWIELCADADKKKFEEQEKLIKEIREIMKRKPRNQRELMEKEDLLYQKIPEYEIFLRKLMNDFGMGKAYRDFDEEAIE